MTGFSTSDITPIGDRMDGIGDSAVKTGQEFAHVGESAWRGKYLLSMATDEARMPNAASLPSRSAPPRMARTAMRAGTGRRGAFLGGLQQIGYLPAVLAAAVVFLFCPALILVIFRMSLMAEPLAERQVRLWMAERLRERGYGTSAG